MGAEAMLHTKKTTARRSGLVSAPVLALAFWLVGANASSAADSVDAACSAVPGTYVTTITDIEGVFASRGLVTFSSDGTVIVADSRQAGQTGVFEPFSTGQGAWTCAPGDAGQAEVKGVSLTFTLATGRTRSTFGRVDFSAEVSPNTGRMSGTLALRFTPNEDVEDADPIANPGPIHEEFGFEGARLVIE